MKIARVILGLLAGCVVAVLVAEGGFGLLRTVWPEYAAAEADKAYTLAMLASRLLLGAVLTSVAACVATLVAGDGGRTAWYLGAIFLALSLPVHLYTVWNDYPAWYHFVYLLYLVPVAGYSGRALVASMGSGARSTPAVRASVP